MSIEPQELQDATDKLNDRLNVAEAKIRTWNPRVRAAVPLGGDAELYWCKDSGGWGLFIRPVDQGMTHILKASRRLRIAAAEQLPALIAEVRAERIRLLADTKRAAEVVDAFLDTELTDE
jgi:hypothetical protein